MASETVFDLPNNPEEFGLDLPLSSLRKIDFTALEFDTALRAIIEYTKTYHPDKFNDFVSDNGFIVISEVLSYLTELLSFRADNLANESFLPTALTRDAVSQHLELIGEAIQSATPAIANIMCSLNSPIKTDLIISAGTTFELSGRAADGGSLFYEIYKTPGDFDSNIIIPASKAGTVAYGIEGRFATPFTAVSGGDVDQKVVVVDDNILSSPVFVELSTGNGPLERWARVEVIERSDPGAKVFEARFEEGKMVIVFGNGEFGRAPTEGQKITIRYRTGGGVNGRIVSNLINSTKLLTPQPPLTAPVQVRFRNLEPSQGGTDEESLKSAKRRAPKVAATHNSIISGEDYAVFAQGFKHPVYGAVLKASAAVKTSININRIELYVLAIGASGEPVKPSLGLKTGLANALSDINVFTDEVVVMDGNIKPINIDMVVSISKSVDPPTVKSAVDAAVESFFDTDNLDMGVGIKISNLYELVQDIDGVQYVDIYEPTDNVLEANVATTTDKSKIGFGELITVGSLKITYYLEPPSQQRI